MKAYFFPIIMWLCLLTSCRSTHKVTSTNTFATDSAVQVQRHQWQTSRMDSVWQHTELSFDSCIVSFGVGAETPTIEAPHALQDSSSAKAHRDSRQKPQVIRIYGAHLSSSRKKCTIAEEREEDSLANARQSSLQQVQRKESMARPWTSPIKLGLTLVFLAALAAFWWCHRRSSDA